MREILYVNAPVTLDTLHAFEAAKDRIWDFLDPIGRAYNTIIVTDFLIDTHRFDGWSFDRSGYFVRLDYYSINDGSAIIHIPISLLEKPGWVEEMQEIAKGLK